MLRAQERKSWVSAWFRNAICNPVQEYETEGLCHVTLVTDNWIDSHKKNLLSFSRYKRIACQIYASLQSICLPLRRNLHSIFGNRASLSKRECIRRRCRCRVYSIVVAARGVGVPLITPFNGIKTRTE